ncbi:MAG: hypothetical protein WA602_10980 [Silvibacterium sp.]
MSQTTCEQESSVVASIRTGESTVELDNHLATCAICSETKHVTQSLQQYAAMTSAQSQPPAPKRMWRKMQEQRQHFARKQATRGLALMWGLATVYFVALAVRYLPAVWHAQSAEFELAYSSLSSGMVIVSVAIAFPLIALGSCYLLFADGRIDVSVAHK